MRLAPVVMLGFGLALPAQQQGQPVEAAMTRLARSAEQDLARSVEQLDQLRTQIGAEKLPMAQELTALEERVSQLRREHEKVTRSVDAGNLAVAMLTTEMKARQVDLDYTSGLLNEYARAFESKVSVGELQAIGPVVEAAKQAVENPAWSPDEKFGRQLALVDASMTRLEDVVGGTRFPGTGIDSQGTVVEGQFAILGPVALFSSKGGAAGIAVPQAHSQRPLIRPLEGEMQAGIVAIVTQGEGALPLDPSRGGALAALVSKFNLVHVFEKGGPIMWPLLIASIIALAVVLERLLFLLNEKRKRSQKARSRLFGLIEAGKTGEAMAMKSKDYVVKTLLYAMAHKGESLTNALLYAQGRELKRMRRGLPVLDTVITLAPLLGLLGTVTGMMSSFSMISGELSSPGAITGGIAEALIATAFGLGIAITALLPFNWLNARLEDARHELESAATQLELLMKGKSAPGHDVDPSHLVMAAF